MDGAPDAAALREAALTHLARYAASAARLLRVLDRRIDRWARRQPSEDREALAAAVAGSRTAARDVVRRLVASGVVDDAAFAASRTRALLRSGRSRRAAGAHLAAHGIDAALARQALADDAGLGLDPEEVETASAAAAARRKRIGPFRAADPDRAADPERELIQLLRAGFPARSARDALGMTREAAETLIARLRQG